MAKPAQRLSLATVDVLPVRRTLDILKYNMLIICGDMNTQKGKVENNKFGLHNLPNWNI